MSIYQKDLNSGQVKATLGSVSIVLRILVGGVGAAVTVTVVQLLVQLLHLPVPSTTLPVLSPDGAGVNILSGVLITAVLTPLARRLCYRAPMRILSLFVPYYIIESASNLIELYFFSGITASALFLDLAIDAVSVLVVVSLIAWLIPAADHHRIVPGAERSQRRPLVSWLWRVVLAGLLYVPIYIIFGALYSPIFLRFYNTSTNSLHLIIPPLGLWAALEAVRGLLYVAALLPVLAVMRSPRWLTALYLFVVIAAFNGWVPMLESASWPALLRFGHLLEISSDSLVHGLVIGLLLALPARTVKDRSTTGIEKPAVSHGTSG